MVLEMLLLVLTIHSIQMEMTKEQIRGPIKCCEALASDMCLQFRAEELVYNKKLPSNGAGFKESRAGRSTRRFISCSSSRR
jgi:hypothetical protein